MGRGNKLGAVVMGLLLLVGCGPELNHSSEVFIGGASWDNPPPATIQLPEEPTLLVAFPSGVMAVTRTERVLSITPLAPPPGHYGPIDAWIDLEYQAPVGPSRLGQVEVRIELSCDFDGDTDLALRCGGDDCDDEDPTRGPSREEACNQRDDNCDDEVDNARDVDADGWDLCEDCDDLDPRRHPSLNEVCDGIDNNCDGTLPADELDVDGDGYIACLDCDDTSAFVRPDGGERCDGLDSDCDPSTWASGGEADLDGDGAPACADCDDLDADRTPGAEELCDGIDNDCGGVPDFGGALETDADGDGWFTCEECNDGSPATFPGAVEQCDGDDTDCDGVIPADELVDADGDGSLLCADCDDTDAVRAPGNAELCDGGDNDCDLATWAPGGEVDHDGDGFLACADCNDLDSALLPGATELCDGLDNDCDASTEVSGEYDEQDGDGFLGCEDCDDTNAAVNPAASEVCDGFDTDCVPGNELAGEFTDVDGDGSLACNDCDDLDPLNMPGGIEVCDGLDNDCDPTTLDGDDGDGDGTVLCLDCDDADPLVYPGAPEICNGQDTDCDGQADEGLLRVPQDLATLSDALSLAVAGDVVCLGPGIWSGTFTLPPGVDLIGALGSAATILDGQGAGTTLSIAGSNYVEVRGLTVTGGFVPTPTVPTPMDAAGLWITTSILTLTDVAVFGNVSGGSALAAVNTLLTVSDVSVSSNIGQFAVRTWGGAMTGERLFIQGNTSTWHSWWGTFYSVSCDDCVWANNVHVMNGAELYVQGNAFLDRNRFVSNSGSAVSVQSGFLDARNSVFLNNGGAAIGYGYTSQPGPYPVVLENNVFHHSGTSPTSAIGLNTYSPIELTVTNCSFTGTTAYSAIHVTGLGALFPYTIESNNFLTGGIAQFFQFPSPVGTDGNVSVEPEFLDTSGLDPLTWDLHLDPVSPLVNAGIGADPDGSPADIGIYGGANADLFDRDNDGFLEWYQPGPYDPVNHPPLGLDCDDLDPAVFPGQGC